MKIDYKNFIESNLTIIDKLGQEIPFKLNSIQSAYVEQRTDRDIILKARQQGFSSLILAMFLTDFLLIPNSNSVVVADKADNAIGLLERVKYYLRSLEKHGKVPLKYNSKYNLVNASNNATYTIGTAQEQNFGRSRTITNLHLSEAAFYPNLPMMLAGAAQAVPPTGKLIIETTANGFNEFKTLWDTSVLKETSYQPLFYKASDFYEARVLRQRQGELGDNLYRQEYPESPEEAFILSGASYFEKPAMEAYLKASISPLTETSHAV